MTPEERAKTLMDRWVEGCADVLYHKGDWNRDIARVLRAAIAEEREVCAKIVYDKTSHVCSYDYGCSDCERLEIATAIRTRGTNVQSQ